MEKRDLIISRETRAITLCQRNLHQVTLPVLVLSDDVTSVNKQDIFAGTAPQSLKHLDINLEYT